LRAEGYSIEIRGGYLVIREVPYLDHMKQVRRGTLVAKLVLAGDEVSVPDTHTIHFIGEYPHHADGTPIEKFRCNCKNKELCDGVTVNHQFSAKPQPSGRYDDYYHQVTTYCAILGGSAVEIDRTATARCFAPNVPDAEEDCPFHYLDTASSRSEISAISKKLAIGKVAIVGLGGTGAYVLDLVAKTPVREIHLFDKDRFLSHNAFRGPGAPSIEELRSKPLKVEYFARIYSRMHRGITPHPVHVKSEDIELLRGMDFVFLCIDDGLAKRFIIRELEDFGISFVDVGMGLYVGDDGLGGMVRVTISTPDQREHFRSLVPLAADDGQNEYSQNIQVADLNALNASMAVIKWKKTLGFYMDFQHECQSTYGVEVQLLTRVEPHA
jgi:Dinucleotide-utilizing enzymes involved in molybdopterin and thiamine biosynthesis family 2